MVIDQTAATVLGTVASDINSRLSDTNGRIDGMQQNVRT
jgi:hypothetical protein